MEKNNQEEKSRLEKQIAFLTEVDKEKNIFRQTYLADGKRKENDAEHSWHLALAAVLLKDHMKEDADLGRVMTMVLIHDLVEIDAGDTYAYDTEGAATKREREVKAADRIFGILPEDQGTYLRELWDEFEAYDLHHKVRLSMKPGLTGMWQVSGRSEITDFEEIVKLDEYYIENWSLKLDRKIIFKTFKVVLAREGAE